MIRRRRRGRDRAHRNAVAEAGQGELVGSGVRRQPVLKIRWMEPAANGYTDAIPLEWLADEGTRADAEHMMISPGGRKKYPARCSVRVRHSTVVFDYGGVHTATNQAGGVDIGKMKIVFSDITRQSIRSVQWKWDGEKKNYENSSVIASIEPDYVHEDDAVLGIEGAARLVAHIRRERIPGLRALKMNSVLEAGKGLKCEACEFEFDRMYCPIGRGACEVHHRQALAAAGPHEITLEHLAILCANCHRAIHQTDPLLDVPEFARTYLGPAVR